MSKVAFFNILILCSLYQLQVQLVKGASHVKLIKTDIRNSLSENTLSNGIFIRLHSAPIDEFDPIPAIEYWLSLKERRPGTSGSTENKNRGIDSQMI